MLLLQAVVQEALNRLMAGRTVVVVAHRLSTIRDAHRICVVSQGQVAEQGSHEQLMAAKGMYAQLIGRQLTSSSSPSLSRPASVSSLSVFSAGGCDSEGSRGCSVDAVVPAAAAAASGGSAADTPRGGAGSSSSAGSSHGVSRS
jgi:ABC-type proline/glycine betaine transport system ATPase subunit